MNNEKKTRDAIQNVAHRIKEQAKKEGRSISSADAQTKARSIAINYEKRQQQ